MSPSLTNSKNQSTNVEKPLRNFSVGKAKVAIFSSRASLGSAAAAQGVELIRAAIIRRGRARVIIATGNSQQDMIGVLVQSPRIDWKRTVVFHMDEYLGMSADHPASFRHWLRKHLLDRASPAEVHRSGKRWCFERFRTPEHLRPGSPTLLG